MKLITSPHKKFKDEENHDLFVMAVEYEISKTEAAAQYKGPKITPEVWWPVVNFFRKVNEEHHSEAQVRLFVNVEKNEWRAWAFPQEERTGMSTNEIDNDEAKEQRKMFPASEGWIYFGTIHSHCGASAFQSSADEHNEKTQDGIHITVGYIDKPKLDIHARFYRKGMKFEPDLSEFWDVDAMFSGIPKLIMRLLKPSSRHDLAKEEMSEFKEAEFPEQWMKNLIPKPKQAYAGVVTYGAVATHGAKYSYKGNRQKGFMERRNDSVQQIISECVKGECCPDLIKLVEGLNESIVWEAMIEIFWNNGMDALDIREVVDEIGERIDVIERRMAKHAQEGGGSEGKGEEDPDWTTGSEDAEGSPTSNGDPPSEVDRPEHYSIDRMHCEHRIKVGNWCHACGAFVI